MKQHSKTGWCAAIIAIVTATSMPVAGQSVHEVPFASAGNTLKLTLENSTGQQADAITVKAVSVPRWMNIHTVVHRVESIPAGGKELVVFEFDIAPDAAAGEPDVLKIRADSGGELQWQRQIEFAVSAPESFELDANYPNPFNPSTIIQYRLPAQSMVRVEVFDMLGRRVALLVNDQREPGLHREVFNAGGYGSGMYLYRVVARTADGRQFAKTGKMLLVK